MNQLMRKRSSKWDRSAQNVVYRLMYSAAISMRHETRWSDSGNNDIGLRALNWIICDSVKWIEFQQRPTLFRALYHSVDSLRPRKYLCNIYDRLMHGAAWENRYTRIPPKAIRSFIFPPFSPIDIGRYAVLSRAPSPPSPAANIPMAITRIMSTWFFIAHECGYVNAIARNRMTFIYFIHGNQRPYISY